MAARRSRKRCRGPKTRADIDDQSAAGVVVPADGLIVVEAAGAQCQAGSILIANRSPFGNSDLDRYQCRWRSRYCLPMETLCVKVLPATFRLPPKLVTAP